MGFPVAPPAAFWSLLCSSRRQAADNAVGGDKEWRLSRLLSEGHVELLTYCLIPGPLLAASHPYPGNYGFVFVSST